jgi:hypothetical protein
VSHISDDDIRDPSRYRVSYGVVRTEHKSYSMDHGGSWQKRLRPVCGFFQSPEGPPKLSVNNASTQSPKINRPGGCCLEDAAFGSDSKGLRYRCAAVQARLATGRTAWTAYGVVLKKASRGGSSILAG